MWAAALPEAPGALLFRGWQRRLDSSIAEAESDGIRDRQIQTEMFHRLGAHGYRPGAHVTGVLNTLAIVPVGAG